MQTVAAVTATVIVVVGVVVIGGRTVMSAADMRGAAVLGQQDAQVAIPIAERATERTPWWPDAWLSLSLAHTRAGDAEAARAAALEAYERDANRRREAVRVLASLETTLDDLEEAERWQRRSLELDSYGFDRRFAVVDWALENDREELTVDTLDELERVLTPQMPQWERLEERRDSYLEASGEPT